MLFVALSTFYDKRWHRVFVYSIPVGKRVIIVIIGLQWSGIVVRSDLTEWSYECLPRSRVTYSRYGTININPCSKHRALAFHQWWWRLYMGNILERDDKQYTISLPFDLFCIIYKMDNSKGNCSIPCSLQMDVQFSTQRKDYFNPFSYRDCYFT